MRRPTRTASGSRRATLGVEQLEDRTTPATLPPGFTETVAAAGLSGPTAMEFAPNGDLWVLEQGGALKRFRPGNTTADLVANIGNLGLRSEGERGLLGIAFDPNYASNKFIYLYYTSSNAPNPHNRVSRFTVDDSNPADYSLVDTPGDPAVYDEHVILDLDPLSSATNHNGGAIHFGPDGKLYVAVGDNADGSHSQTLSTRFGKILRINADGTIPSDNPTSLAGIAGTPTGANQAIWAAGLRNPFTFTFQPGTGVMFINDVGQSSWEEIDVGLAGRNFGWDVTEGAFDHTAFPNFTEPRYTYSHGSGTFQGDAITGGAFYNPATMQFPAGYAGDYFFADFVNGWIHVMNSDGTGVRPFATNIGGPVDLLVGGDGSLYYLAHNDGEVFRVRFTGTGAPAVTQQPQDASVGEGGTVTFTVAAKGLAPLEYHWQKLNGTVWTKLVNGNGVSGALSKTLTLTGVEMADAGQYRVVVLNSVGLARSNVATLTVTPNDAPTATITIDSGLTNGKFVAGQAIGFSGTATDTEDGTLGAGAFAWRVDYITGTASGHPVIHPFVPEFTGQTSGTFTPATTGAYTATDVAYRITLTVHDSVGRTTTETLDIDPNVANITVQTSHAGLTVAVDGKRRAAGTVIPSVVGFEHTVGAAAAQTAGGFLYHFDSWSDGGAAKHTVITPASDTTLTAKYLFSVKINFQPAGVPIPVGYFADTGAVFARRINGYRYGWNADISSTAVDRNAPNSPDQRYDTVIRMQPPMHPNAFWELAVPDGTYQVRVVAGDPTRTNSVYRIDAEGVLAIDGTPTAGNLWFDNTVTVTVTDGRLTITSAAGAQNNRINFIEVTEV
jgi:glucose/arabinose dehydrogenase